MNSRAPLFSTGITIKDFRGYGAFTLDLPATPCVVLLSGPNGLGKTSLFEAVEWALTGSVKRLDHVSGGKADPRDLARHAGGVDAFEVTLRFRDAAGREERINRAQLIPASATSMPASFGTSVESVADILGSGDRRWNVNGKNLADYLHLTHLHAQVAFLRLVTFDAKKRWMCISPLAGADRFERVRTNLTNSKKELTALQERREQEHADTIGKRERWKADLARLDQLQQVAGAVHDLLSPADVSRAVHELHLRLGIESAGEPTREDALGDASDALRRLRVATETEGAGISRRMETLGRLRALPQQVADTRTQHAAATDRSVVLATELDRLRAVLAALEEASNAQRAVYEDAVRKQRTAAERHELTVRAQRDRADLPTFVQELAEAEEQLQAAARRKEELDVELRGRIDELRVFASLVLQRDSTRVQLAAVDRALDALAEIENLWKRHGEEEAKRNELMNQMRRLDADIDAAAAEQRTRDDAVAAISREIESLRQVFDTLNKALLTIAEHVRDEDTKCPVCRTHFETGVLRGLAHDVLGAADPKLAQAESRLSAAKAGLDELRKQQEQRRLDRRKVEADLRVANDNIAQLKIRITGLRTDPLIGSKGSEEARLELTVVRTTLLGDRDRIEQQLAEAGEKDRRKAVLDATSAVETHRRLLGETQERRSARQTRIEQLLARISQTQTDRPDLAGEAQSLSLIAQADARAASNAKDAANAASVQVGEAVAKENAARQALSTTEGEVERVTAQIEALSSALSAHESRWREAGLSAPISERSLESLMESLGMRQGNLSEGLQQVARLGAALERWRQADEVRGLEAQLTAQCGSSQYSNHTVELDQAVEAARAAAVVAQRARDASDQLSGALKKITADFGGRALRPFDELFRRYLRALIHDDRFHTIAATYEPAARSAGLSFKVGLGGLDTEAEHILSEGQLGEVSLATMLAASTAFPWSRWRVLLLDDPTQYNDLIHSTSLFDVLRNLVRSVGYQIFLSTHDNEQASFLRRKLDAIGVPWVECRYLGHSPEGLVHEQRRSFDGVGANEASVGE